MSAVPHPTFVTRMLRLLPAAVLTAGVLGLAACGADGNDSSLPGQSLSLQYGCMACHNTTGQPAVGPTWKGLYGSQVKLKDGTTASVDRDYLVRASKEPNAQIPADAKVLMPKNSVPDADVQLIVDYIVSLK